MNKTSDTAHNVMIAVEGQCPWCGKEKRGKCGDPNGQERVRLA